MTCNTCFKSFSLLRPEKGCPNCGFSYCSKCLNHKIFVPKLNAANKVCLKCKGTLAADSGKSTVIAPPDAYFKRIAGSMNPENTTNTSSTDDEVRRRLDKLKEEEQPSSKTGTDDEIQLQNTSSTTDADLHARLAKLRGFELPTETKPIIMTKDLRTEQEQVEDLMKQYVENAAIDSKYKDEFDTLVNDMEARVQRLRGEASRSQTKEKDDQANGQKIDTTQTPDSDDEEEVLKVVEKIKAQAMQEEDDIAPSTNDELPFCEICNEDATLRCLGCRYLFCKRCFKEHRDDDDDCNRSEPYRPSKGSQY